MCSFFFARVVELLPSPIVNKRKVGFHLSNFRGELAVLVRVMVVKVFCNRCAKDYQVGS